MQHYAGIYLLQNNATCFGCPSHPSSGVHKTVTAASGTGKPETYRVILQQINTCILLHLVGSY